MSLTFKGDEKIVVTRRFLKKEAAEAFDVLKTPIALITAPIAFVAGLLHMAGSGQDENYSGKKHNQRYEPVPKL